MTTRKEERREEALERNEQWEKFTPEEQLKQLDLRLGVGKGAHQQRERILNKIQGG